MGPYKSCAALLAIPNPLILILVLSNLLKSILTFELVCGWTEWDKLTKKFHGMDTQKKNK